MLSFTWARDCSMNCRSCRAMSSAVGPGGADGVGARGGAGCASGSLPRTTLRNRGDGGKEMLYACMRDFHKFVRVSFRPCHKGVGSFSLAQPFRAGKDGDAAWL